MSVSCDNKKKTNEELYFNNLINLFQDKIVLNLMHFRKSKDYTSLIEYIIKNVDNYKQYGNEHNVTLFLDLYIDFSKIKMANIDIEFIKMLLRFLQDRYTDIIKQIICINVSMMVRFVYKILKSCLDKDTRDKITIIPNSKNGSQKYDIDSFMSLEHNTENKNN